MLLIVSWAIVLVLLGLWSVAAWTLHAIAAWAVANAGAFAGAVPGTAGLQLPAWLAPWVPPELAALFAGWLSGLAPAMEAVLQQMPLLGGMLTGVTWIVWGLGALLLLVLGAVVHGLIAAGRRRLRRPPAAPAGAVRTD